MALPPIFSRPSSSPSDINPVRAQQGAHHPDNARNVVVVDDEHVPFRDRLEMKGIETYESYGFVAEHRPFYTVAAAAGS